ncbi:transcriptional regulator, AraC family [Hymenobacter roseosalivarius DSM 11622]|uniref:Transcriptional regulator, AraC family n=1 Tax=Hymenobacter roseosalivarius DSM 11622 TaxID=645990 RepID=A0A1W1VGF4_9BACT|nr:helix-turn-helix domain-containing protein [Hymenobacter roseosalivarius]SMB92438.1 transcriptional regulator, AraC family [Hymenobacter roseosalivarius DSM 11622]
MILQSFPPAEELRPFVCGYLYGRSAFAAPQVLPTIPRGVPALMIILPGAGGAPLEFLQPMQSGPLTAGAYLMGQATECWLLKVGATQAYMVALRPVALPALGLVTADYTDSVVKLDGLLPECRFLMDELAAQISQLGQLTVLDAFLKRLFRNATARPDEVHGAMHRIFQTQGQVKIGQLAQQERISPRSLTRKFTDLVGLSPKQYAHVIRFQAVMHYLLRTHNAPWLDVVHRFGYYDQSHFIKDFQHFTGRPPTLYLAADRDFDGRFIQVVAAL